MDELVSDANQVELEIVLTLFFLGGGRGNSFLVLIPYLVKSHQTRTPTPQLQVTLPSLERPLNWLTAKGGSLVASCLAWLPSLELNMACRDSWKV